MMLVFIKTCKATLRHKDSVIYEIYFNVENFLLVKDFKCHNNRRFKSGEHIVILMVLSLWAFESNHCETCIKLIKQILVEKRKPI